MSLPILATKLYIPPSRPNLVKRPRLIERLNEGLVAGCRLTLISAPAGFGKTSLVSEWIAAYGKPAAWLSLDEGENDPARFLSYLIAALQSIKPGLADGLLALLQSPQAPQTESTLITLLNEVDALPENFILVLDDYHALDSKSVVEALALLLQHQPSQMHLVIATREDPPLPLASLRARGQLSELRFSPIKAAGLLEQALGLTLSARLNPLDCLSFPQFFISLESPNH